MKTKSVHSFRSKRNEKLTHFRNEKILTLNSDLPQRVCVLEHVAGPNDHQYAPDKKTVQSRKCEVSRD